MKKRKYTIVMIVDTILERKKKGCCDLSHNNLFKCLNFALYSVGKI